MYEIISADAGEERSTLTKLEIESRLCNFHGIFSDMCVMSRNQPVSEITL